MKRLFGCAIWVSSVLVIACGPHFDQESADHFTALKTTHLGFIDRFTGDTFRVYDESEVKTACNQTAQEFDKAKSYMEGKRDEKRLKALQYLRTQFDEDCRFLHSVEKLFSQSYASEHKAALGANYDHAIAAEYGSVGDRE